MFRSINEIKRRNAAEGYHFFEPGSLRFFSSRILDGVYGGRFFVTSEKRTGFRCEDGPRLYSVRAIRDDGSIDTIGGFQRYVTRAQAIGAAKRAAAGCAS